jgi:uncharacterized protein (TIGR03435 family)
MKTMNLTRKLAALAIAAGIANVPESAGQAQSKAVTSKFEVATVKPCAPGSRMTNNLRGGTPGRVMLGCMSLRALITNSYVFYANGRWNQPTPRIVPIEKRPAWADSDLYTIEAKAEGTPSPGTMLGPMMQALLEDRFHLKLHTEFEEIPVYVLTVANGGPKLQRSREGSCQPMLSDQPAPVPVPGKTPLPICGRSQSGNGEFRLSGATLADIAASLGSDREVIDKTGIEGTFDVRVRLTQEFVEMLAPRAPAPPPGGPPATVAPANSPGPSDIFYMHQAIAQMLGLKLEPGKGPGRILVIDHVERPSEN